ncbi:hypothetical protein [Streptomyces nymphaeiformis]|uniref:Gram-positive cocci surface proteins LPxTG domain-containing protein n=1 Tax=Streptomyces nymphaeiformis TaxID=2663842 RepID=A0A7W7XES4_9ACTN|nr:hypothetical protein [Streptomyces nymphaeiformis]MBB4985457.1 hypothetical protein [Streptomyces nymphaeiformis]
MTTPPTRALLRAALATMALSAVTLGGAPAAFAAPGDNGDVKVHRQGTPDSSQANEPQVGCVFRFAAFNFDGLQSIQWNIYEQPGLPGNQDPSLKNGSIAIDSNGDGHTDDITGLASGMYKVEWTWVGQNGAAKSKVFRVNCDNGNGGNGNGGNGNGGNGNGGNGNGGNGNGGNGNGGNGGGHGHKPHGPVGAGGGGSAQLAAEDSSAFGVGAAVAAGLAGTAGLVLIRRSRRRDNGAA